MLKASNLQNTSNDKAVFTRYLVVATESTHPLQTKPVT